MFLKLLICIAILVGYSYQGHTVKILPYQMVHVLDTIGHNFLFRTEKPIFNKTIFTYNETVAMMKQRATEDGYNWNDNLQIHIYSLLLTNSTVRDENFGLQVEVDFFKANPDKGRIIHFELGGSMFYANNLPGFMRKELGRTYREWGWDRLDKIVSMVYEDLRKQEHHQKCIIIHCWTGLDRTGELFGAYLMDIKNWSYKRALDFNNALIQDLPTRTWSRNGLNWYCWYLFYYKNQGGDCKYEPELTGDDPYAIQP